MAKSFPKNPEKNDKGTNMRQISRSLMQRDTNGGDNRYRERVKPMAQHKNPKYKNWRNADQDDY